MVLLKEPTVKEDSGTVLYFLSSMIQNLRMNQRGHSGLCQWVNLTRKTTHASSLKYFIRLKHERRKITMTLP